VRAGTTSGKKENDTHLVLYQPESPQLCPSIPKPLKHPTLFPSALPLTGPQTLNLDHLDPSPPDHAFTIIIELWGDHDYERVGRVESDEVGMEDDETLEVVGFGDEGRPAGFEGGGRDSGRGGRRG
jgi:hypothetical protein